MMSFSILINAPARQRVLPTALYGIPRRRVEAGRRGVDDGTGPTLRSNQRRRPPAAARARSGSYGGWRESFGHNWPPLSDAV